MMDRVREALFNILAHRDWGKAIGELFEEETHALDAFCGTGALAFEALSWGVGFATLLDKDAQALNTTRHNATSLGIASKCRILSADATQPPVNSAAPHKLVFLAPPYRKNLIPPSFLALDAAGWIASRALIVVETAKNEHLENLPGCAIVLSRFYGDTGLHFFSR
jgi:16S rRNA (guanine966-N2)-methyltransferase